MSDWTARYLGAGFVQRTDGDPFGDCMEATRAYGMENEALRSGQSVPHSPDGKVQVLSQLYAYCINFQTSPGQGVPREDLCPISLIYPQHGEDPYQYMQMVLQSTGQHPPPLAVADAPNQKLLSLGYLSWTSKADMIPKLQAHIDSGRSVECFKPPNHIMNSWKYSPTGLKGFDDRATSPGEYDMDWDEVYYANSWGMCYVDAVRFNSTGIPAPPILPPSLIFCFQTTEPSFPAPPKGCLSIQGDVYFMPAGVMPPWPVPTGTVQFFDQGVLLANNHAPNLGATTITLDVYGKCMFYPADTGAMRSITAIYNGDTMCAGSTSQPLFIPATVITPPPPPPPPAGLTISDAQLATLQTTWSQVTVPTITQAQIDTMQGVLTQLAGGTVITPPPPPPGGTTTITPGVGSITTPAGDVWTIGAVRDVRRNGQSVNYYATSLTWTGVRIEVITADNGYKRYWVSGSTFKDV